MFSAADHEYMARALRLAENGLYSTTPNPRVACLIVKDGAVVGEGYHRRAGEAHDLRGVVPHRADGRIHLHQGEFHAGCAPVFSKKAAGRSAGRFRA